MRDTAPNWSDRRIARAWRRRFVRRDVRDRNVQQWIERGFVKGLRGAHDELGVEAVEALLVPSVQSPPDQRTDAEDDQSADTVEPEVVAGTTMQNSVAAGYSSTSALT